MPAYSYATCLRNSFKASWTLDEVLERARFARSRRWMPLALSGAAKATCLDEEGRRALTQVEMAAYAHLFGFVETFIAPQVNALAGDFALTDRTAFEALANFAAEEVKHMNLFRAVRERVDAELGFALALVDGEQETARAVLGKSRAAVLLLTSAIEWMTQRHYLECMRDDAGLDPATLAVFKAHWQEESQHAQLDHLESVRAFAALTPAGREQAVDDLIELVAAVDGLLKQQCELDIDNLGRCLRRTFTPAQREELFGALLEAKRWTFILSGVTHPRFEQLFVEVTTPEQRERVSQALAGLAHLSSVDC